MRANEYGDSRTNMEEKVKAREKNERKQAGKENVTWAVPEIMKKQERKDGFGSEVRELKEKRNR